jgi:hypothetical protein
MMVNKWLIRERISGAIQRLLKTGACSLPGYSVWSIVPRVPDCAVV